MRSVSRQLSSLLFVRLRGTSFLTTSLIDVSFMGSDLQLSVFCVTRATARIPKYSLKHKPFNRTLRAVVTRFRCNGQLNTPGYLVTSSDKATSLDLQLPLVCLSQRAPLRCEPCEANRQRCVGLSAKDPYYHYKNLCAINPKTDFKSPRKL